ncbi:selenocysteine lyase/cysteine desulfurase [Cryobacterium mesophilum]|uniref:Aminotransferase class V-fold PLP-dependent enzyme n=1 Tax=Terrimesophilobacter mesophilus TaxID=433647 RepID=A0A4R8VCL8_9MICO|nr:aminotransferase class V-fold PLP-dependent enzyme [Terrimesophilobacter mesophilus]MBB5633775.1 selenocysteine lyase/cysteine desulfurase [Terrimesophilobacter mesophilus]TFB80455.1 aminotransferase class V-fold PLP-dependent enzyme [Terrimesophilobacter mesophilus]
MLTIDEFALEFDEEPGYLDFGRVGPLARVVVEEERAQVELLRTARFGSLDSLMDQDARLRQAVANATGFREDGIVFQPNTSMGLMQVMFGITGGVLLSPDEFPSSPFAAVRSSDAMGRLEPHWLETDYGRVTPGIVKSHLTKDIVAVAVSLVDYRTGYLADLEGIRQVIGDRLLIVDAIQGFTVADVDYTLADVVASGGQKWARAGWSTGFLAMSDRAIERVSPVLSGFNATDEGPMPTGSVPDAARGARAFQVSNPSPIAQARLAASLEQLAKVGIDAVAERVIRNSAMVIDLADEFGIPVVSPRDDRERAGIVVIEPAADQLTILIAALHNHGVTVTARDANIRISVHASTTEQTLAMLRASFQDFASATTI